MKKKILFVFGTRPETIKMAPVIKLFRESKDFDAIVCTTGQHREMLDQSMRIFGLESDYELQVMKKNQTLTQLTVNILSELDNVLEEISPNLLIVQGDTTTSFAGGLAAYYKNIPIGHIEAGLRTGDKYKPFPEEKNRHMLSTLSDLHFAPTDVSKENLIREGVDKEKIWVTGNTVIDAMQIILASQESDSEDEKKLCSFFNQEIGVNFENPPETIPKIILVTAHRRENFGKGIRNICEGLYEIAAQRPEVLIVYPVHLNPKVQDPVRELIGGVGNIKLIPPVDYEKFLFLLKKTYLVVTDSGGIQEEAPSLGKPVLVTRETTERPEGVNAGTVKLVGTNKEKMIEEINKLLDDVSYYKLFSEISNPFGDGRAAGRILEVIRSSDY